MECERILFWLAGDEGVETVTTCNVSVRTAPSEAGVPGKESVCAVVISYFPQGDFLSRLRRIRSQVAQLLVVDNGSSGEAANSLGMTEAEMDVDVIRNSANLGIAAALNQGVQWALKKGFTWVLLLDQDTVPSQGMVGTLMRAYEEFPDKNHLAIIGSNRFSNSPSDDSSPPSAMWWTISKMVITSGTLLRLEAARMIGPFREEFFIDCVDFEFCLRARIKGFKIVEILEPIMHHFIGSPEKVRLLWFKKIEMYNHRPWRSYYMVRNLVVLVREYLFKDPAWVSWLFYKEIARFMLILWAEKSRISKLRYMTLGLYDGLTGRFNRAVGRDATLSGMIPDERSAQW